VDEPQESTRIDRLLDAIELVQANQREAALLILRELIREDKDFEEAWLWMSVAVDSPDKSAVCLDNVLRINPNNARASAALFRLREAEMRSQSQRARIRGYRDLALGSLWFLTICVLFALLLFWGARFSQFLS
jgi:hypothetical protein